MSVLLEWKERIKVFYGKYHHYVNPCIRFVLALVVFMGINKNLGYMKRLDNVLFVLLLSFICAFLPMNMLVVSAAVLILLHFTAASLELALVALLIFILMFLLYFRFARKDGLILLITPIAFALNVPCAMPLSMGLLKNPGSAVPVCCGTMVYFMMNTVRNLSITSATAAAEGGKDAMFAQISNITSKMLENQEMYLTIFSFSLTLIVVYVIRRLSVDHAWSIAIAAGSLLNILIMLLGAFLLNITNNVLMLLLGAVLSSLIAMAIHFLAFSVDYSRTEIVQFEDDEYYYYVKAVPKMYVSATEKTVKRINAYQKTSRGAALTETDEMRIEEDIRKL